MDRPFTIRTDHRPLLQVLQQRSDQASTRAQRQLDYILQFNVNFQSVEGKHNVVEDTLACACIVDMPTIMYATSIKEAQHTDIELRPYIPISLKYSAFNLIHGLSHPSGRSTSHLLDQKFFWLEVKKNAAKWLR